MATISGIVMNGPMPTICVMLIAVAESKPTDRWNVWRPAWLAAASGPLGLTSAESVITAPTSGLCNPETPARIAQTPNL